MFPPRMGNLTGLQNLPVFQVGRENGYGIEQLENMAHLSGTLRISKLENAVNAGDAKLNEKKNLHELVFEWSHRDDVNTQDQATIENSVLEDLQPHSNLKKLKIRCFMGNEFPAWMKEGRLQNLVSLTLYGCIKCKTLALGGQLPKLRELYIEGMRELEKWMEVECNSLDRLTLRNCPQLRELPIVFPNLLKLEIKSCDSLRALPEDGLPSSLEHLQIQKCPLLKSIGLKEILKNLRSLRELYIEDCSMLQSLPEDGLPSSLKFCKSKNAPSEVHRPQGDTEEPPFTL
ncbi:hypothetical protein SLA2020_429010 [Shorea laevis]